MGKKAQQDPLETGYRKHEGKQLYNKTKCQTVAPPFFFSLLSFKETNVIQHYCDRKINFFAPNYLYLNRFILCQLPEKCIFYWQKSKALRFF